MQRSTSLVYLSFPTLIASAFLAFSYTARATEPKCMDQGCIDNGSCYQCFSYTGHYCNPAGGQCPSSCKEGFCTAVALAVRYGAKPPEIGLRPCQSPPMTLVALAGNSRGVALGLLPQDDAPAMLMEATHGATDLLQEGKLLVGSRPISKYRIGWIVLYSHARPELAVGKPTSSRAQLRPHTVAVVPSQHIPRTIDARPGVIRVGFFVAEVTFPEGDTWRANPKAIAEAAGLGE